ncbi:P26 [Adoxophyes orana nucleopolyhedrovirus]|uniref:P26 n=1 Tax=Adoxophyes orana nucleopolyhedrovirus TaxID=542343 RepID=UPI0001829BEF|nr:P26 [Adoxophyes orana nucleopolyhedrovirus]ACF05322.1 P26 [Adoxophyes orana nucleopolyhedrovirus]
MIQSIVTLLCLALIATPGTALTVNNVEYTINHLEKTITVTQVDEKTCIIKTFPPLGSTGDQEEYDMLHHFPGVATSVLFPSIKNNSMLSVLLNDGTTFSAVADRVYTNFHSHKKRMVYGQLLSFAIEDFNLANKIYIGAPIFLNNKLISVVTARHDNYKEGWVIYPVTGIRPDNLVSGQFNFDNQIIVTQFVKGMSVYGKRQLPYMALKRYAINTSANKKLYRNMPRSVAVFYNDQDITIALVEGEYEIDRIRLNGPLLAGYTPTPSI